jgi:uncharacterized protein (TIGR03067 family)
MRISSLALLACGVCLSAVVSTPAAGEKDDDMKRLQGTWVVDPATFEEVKDEAVRKEVLKDSQAIRITFAGDTFTLKHPPANDEKSMFRVDPSKNPKEIDMGDGVKGIYELDGDRLKLCWDQQGKVNGRPTKFSLRQGKDTIHYFVLKREKK